MFFFFGFDLIVKKKDNLLTAILEWGEKVFLETGWKIYKFACLITKDKYALTSRTLCTCIFFVIDWKNKKQQ